MTKNWLWLAALALGNTALAETPAAYTLAADSYGPVKIGMTAAEAGKALGVKLVSGDPANAECYFVVPAKGNAEKEISFMLRNYRITRIDLPHDNSGYKTDKGIKIGDSEQKVRQAYGKALTVAQHHYGDKGDHYLTYWQDAKHRRGIRFETMGGKVVGIYGGDKSIELVEGCL